MDKSILDRLAPYIAASNTAIQAYLKDKNLQGLELATGHLINSGGKRLRPVLALLACETVGSPIEKALNYAVAMELLHTFSLVHDDIMDNDDARHGQPTVHVAYGPNVAILAGDALFAMALDAASRDTTYHAQVMHHRISRGIAVLTMDLCRGQFLDMTYEGRTYVTEDEYTEMVRAKTAAFMRTAMEGGAISGDAHRTIAHRLGEAGEAIGLAFQIRDDVLGATASEAQTGKTSLSDLHRGKMTMPIIKCLAELGDESKARFLSVYKQDAKTPADIAFIQAALERTNAIEQSMIAAQTYVNEAREILTSFAPTRARGLLEDICDYAVTRES